MRFCYNIDTWYPVAVTTVGVVRISILKSNDVEGVQSEVPIIVVILGTKNHCNPVMIFCCNNIVGYRGFIVILIKFL